MTVYVSNAPFRQASDEVAAREHQSGGAANELRTDAQPALEVILDPKRGAHTRPVGEIYDVPHLSKVSETTDSIRRRQPRLHQLR